MNNEVSSHGYRDVLAELTRRLQEPAPGRLQLLTGPRQVGKTTALLALANTFKPNATYAAADAPESWLPGWWEALWLETERRARAGSGQYLLLLDEIQILPDWGRQLKSQMDRVIREKLPLHVVVSGSSALQLGSGARETMAGRFEKLRLLHWSAAELAAVFNLPVAEAVQQVVLFGSFPGATALTRTPVRWRDYIRDSIVEPAIGRDLLALEQVRKPGLLRQLFAVCAGHPAEILSLQKISGQLQDKGALETLSHYLHLLEEACLVAGIPKYSEKPIRQRAAPVKVACLNNAFLSAFAPAGPPDPGRDPALWGRWVENACIAHAWNSGQRAGYWRQEPLEVDLVLDGSWGRWAVEVKSGAFHARDLAGLLEFCRLFPKFRPLVLCDRGAERAAEQAGIAWRHWQDYLLRGINGAHHNGTAS